jgi:hypothetical protein
MNDKELLDEILVYLEKKSLNTDVKKNISSEAREILEKFYDF